jgi:hypothetical protein
MIPDNAEAWLFDELARLMLALFLRTDTLVPLKLDAIDGGRLRFSARGRFFAEIELNASSLPARVNYEIALPDGKSAQAAHWVLEEPRVVDGISVPTRIVDFAAGRHRSTYRFKDIQINPRLTSADFRPPKW